MKKLFSLYLILFLIFPTVTYANDVFKHINDEGEEFVCFTTEAAQKLLQIKIDLPKLKLKIIRLNDLLEIQEQQIGSLQNMNGILDQKNVVLLDLNKDLQERIEDDTSFWKSPWLWTGVGIVLGTVGTIGIVYAVKGDL